MIENKTPKMIDDLNKIIPEINALINKYASYPSKANIILRMKNKVELIKTNLQNEYDKYKFEFSNKVYEAEMSNGRGIVEIIQEYANILSEDDINTIAKKACDLYYSNQNEIQKNVAETVV